MPLISVIIPAYNAERTIAETIQSLQRQTCSDFELIVINDGSTDRTLDVLESLQEPRLKVYSYENGGLPTARNRGMARATGEYLSFIDADDLWTRDKLEAQVQALHSHPEAGVAYSWTAFINEHSEYIYSREPMYYEGNVYPHLLLSNFISSGSNIMVRRSLAEQVGEFDPTLRSAEDWDYYIRLATVTSFVVVPQYHILYRRTAQSMTSKVDVMEKYIMTVLERAFAAAPPEYQSLRQRSLASNYRFLAQLCIAHGGDREGVKQAIARLVKAIRLYPSLLLERRTQRLAAKMILLRVLPYRFSRRLSASLGNAFPDASTRPLTLEQEAS